MPVERVKQVKGTAMKVSVKLGVAIGMVGLMVAWGCQPGDERATRPDSRPAQGLEAGLMAQAVVSVHHADGSRYLTEQTHRIDTPTAVFIEATEPTGPCRWQLQEGRFSAGPVAEGAESLCSPVVATAVYVLFSLTDPAASVPADAEGQAVKIDGRWFETIAVQRVTALQVPQGLKVTLLRPVAGDRIDHVRIVDEQGRAYIGQAYDYRRLVEIDRTVPGRIEIRPVSGPGRLDVQYVRITAVGSARATK